MNELLAAPIEVIYPEGVSEGFVTLKSKDGKKLADGELSQLTTGADRLASRLTFRFTDGSLYDETVIFSQKKHLAMLSYHLKQRGPAFPEPLTISLNGETGQYQVRRHEQAKTEQTISGRIDLPADVYNGMTITALKNLRGKTHGSPGTLDLTIPAGESARPDMDLTESENGTASIDRSGIDFILDEPVRGQDESALLPTVEMPKISKGDETAGDAQEPAVDRLGLDLVSLHALESLHVGEASDARKRSGSDTVESTAIMGSKSSLDDDNSDLLNSTALMRMVDDTAMLPADEVIEGILDLSDATGELPALDSTAFTPLRRLAGNPHLLPESSHETVCAGRLS